MQRACDDYMYLTTNPLKPIGVMHLIFLREVLNETSITQRDYHQPCLRISCTYQVIFVKIKVILSFEQSLSPQTQ